MSASLVCEEKTSTSIFTRTLPSLLCPMHTKKPCTSSVLQPPDQLHPTFQYPHPHPTHHRDNKLNPWPFSTVQTSTDHGIPASKRRKLQVCQDSELAKKDMSKSDLESRCLPPVYNGETFEQLRGSKSSLSLPETWKPRTRITKNGCARRVSSN